MAWVRYHPLATTLQKGALPRKVFPRKVRKNFNVQLQVHTLVDWTNSVVFNRSAYSITRARVWSLVPTTYKFSSL